MIKRKIKWSSKAVGQRQLISDWYQTTLGDVAVNIIAFRATQMI